MVASPGEELAVTILADLHYIYNCPTAEPLHHRFDKESHVSLFENASKRRARIEIENQMRTGKKDAVDGYLDEIRVQYSFKHPTLISFTIGRIEDQEWHLPSFDLKNEQISLFKLQSVDIYSWTNDGAIQLLNALRRLLPQENITILYEPIAIHPHYNHQKIGSIAQGLQNMGINDSLRIYPQEHVINSVNSIPGPPISATPNVRQLNSHTPLPYDPAAPAAPEKLTYREKTPPIDDGGINPLRAIVSSELSPYTEDFSKAAHQNYVPSMSSPLSVTSTCFTPNTRCFSILPTSHETLSPVMTSFSKISAQNPVYYHQIPPPQVQSNHSNIPVTQYAIYPNSPGAARNINTPSVYSPEFSTPLMTPIDNSKYQCIGDITNYHTSNAAEYSSRTMETLKLTKEEGMPKSSKPMKASVTRFEERAARLERGVGSLLKKLEKKIG